MVVLLVTVGRSVPGAGQSVTSAGVPGQGAGVWPGARAGAAQLCHPAAGVGACRVEEGGSRTPPQATSKGLFTIQLIENQFLLLFIRGIFIIENT